MHALIVADPGIHVQALASLLGITHSTALHHLHRLEQEGKVRVQKVANRLACYDRTEARVNHKAAKALLHEEDLRQAARAVLDEPGPVAAIAATLGISRAAATRRLERLQDAHLVKLVPLPEGAEVFPEADLEKALHHDAEGDPLTPAAFDKLGFA